MTVYILFLKPKHIAKHTVTCLEVLSIYLSEPCFTAYLQSLPSA